MLLPEIRFHGNIPPSAPHNLDSDIKLTRNAVAGDHAARRTVAYRNGAARPWRGEVKGVAGNIVVGANSGPASRLHVSVVDHVAYDGFSALHRIAVYEYVVRLSSRTRKDVHTLERMVKNVATKHPLISVPILVNREPVQVRKTAVHDSHIVDRGGNKAVAVNHGRLILKARRIRKRGLALDIQSLEGLTGAPIRKEEQHLTQVGGV